MKLTKTLNKTIADFCKNKFIGAEENHCAHFVCHVLEIDSGYDCKTHKNGSHPGACIRVQNLFAECPQVDNWNNAPQGMKIVFVTDKSNVNLTTHTMRNVPKKHVGIFSEGHVYHYSNTQDVVIRQTPTDFLARFQGAYGGNQGLFFGTFPPAAKVPDAETEAPSVTDFVTTFNLTPVEPEPSIRQVTVSAGKFDYFAKLPEVAEYYVASNTKYKSLQGLWQPTSKLNGPRYTIAAFAGEYETVAGMLGVISAGESNGYFNRLNTYDRAAFTFRFFQLAAHTPNDNLILLFRRAAAENSTFQTLFPNLKLVDGVLHRDLGTHTVSVENQYPRPNHSSEQNLKDFMTYLNADGTTIDTRELSTSARLVHLANSDEAFNQLQVSVAAQITMRKLRNAYSVWYNLNGVSDLICTAIADIHHQGRGTKTEVRNALSSADTVQGKISALCKIGEAKYAERCATLKTMLAKAEADEHLGISVFDKASGLFKPKQGWLA
ncbi:hypothetical protein HRH25_21770 [Flavisolibacter sp. BT320]|nr:hypothetical protein [Flavisolibacter longurius]